MRRFFLLKVFPFVYVCIGICACHFLSFHFESVAMLVLAQVAQSLVVSIVGLNLGFRSFLQLFETLCVFHLILFLYVSTCNFYFFPQLRTENLNIWKKILQTSINKVAVATSNQTSFAGIKKWYPYKSNVNLCAQR